MFEGLYDFLALSNWIEVCVTVLHISIYRWSSFFLKLLNIPFLVAYKVLFFFFFLSEIFFIKWVFFEEQGETKYCVFVFLFEFFNGDLEVSGFLISYLHLSSGVLSAISYKSMKLFISELFLFYFWGVSIIFFYTLILEINIPFNIFFLVLFLKISFSLNDFF